ncbi:MAG: hypothetical protein NDJ90_04305 [Oligoflexia bacterium]|nr:hypothetical protein [Oligoflexia bacterium]
MTRLLLRFSNLPTLILVALIGVALQTSLFTFWILPYFRPDIVLLIVLWCALRRSLFEGGLITLVLANIVEAHSASPQGVFLVIYMLIYLLVRVAAHVFVIPDLRSFLFVVIAATAGAKLGSLALTQLLGSTAMPFSQVLRHLLVFVAPCSLMNALIAHRAYFWLDRLDWVTFKNPRAAQILEDELQLDAPEF